MLANIIAGQQAYITNLHNQIWQMNMQLLPMFTQQMSNKFQGNIPNPIQYPGGQIPTSPEEMINSMFHNEMMNKMLQGMNKSVFPFGNQTAGNNATIASEDKDKSEE
jgi:hypothetical protein